LCHTGTRAARSDSNPHLVSACKGGITAGGMGLPAFLGPLGPTHDPNPCHGRIARRCRSARALRERRPLASSPAARAPWTSPSSRASAFSGWVLDGQRPSPSSALRQSLAVLLWRPCFSRHLRVAYTKDAFRMFDIHREVIDWAGRKLVLETGKIARQADGAVLASYGETTVLATVVSAKAPKAGQDFFPLTVNYQEKAFAAGRIPGGYSSAKAARRKRKRWFPASSTGRSGRCFPRATATTPRSSSPSSPMISRTIPTCSPWSRPRRP